MFERVRHNKLLLVVGLLGLALVINLGPHAAKLLRGGERAGFSVWGANNYGQIGRGSIEYKAYEPFERQPDMPAPVQMALGLNHSLALTADGTVYAWGSNRYGQIGQPAAIKLKTEPAVVKGLPKITQIAANQDHSAALAADGSVYTWGLNMSGQLGNGNNTDSYKPLRVPGVRDAAHIAAGYRTTLAIKNDGSLWAWGGDCQLQTKRDNNFREAVAELAIDGAYAEPSTAAAKTGQYTALSPEEDCINEDVVGIKSVKPKRIEGLPALTTVAAGFGHMLAIDRTGQVWAWGCNTYGQVGNGTVGRGTGANLRPAKVEGMADVAAVSAGFRHSLVLKRDGSLWAWGHNYSGALGTGKAQDQNPRPARVAALPPLRAVAAGHDFSLVVARGGEVYGWGDGSAWQLGTSQKQRRTPVHAWELRDVSGIAVGGGHAAALRTTDNAPRREGAGL